MRSACAPVLFGTCLLTCSVFAVVFIMIMLMILIWWLYILHIAKWKDLPPLGEAAGHFKWLYWFLISLSLFRYIYIYIYIFPWDPLASVFWNLKFKLSGGGQGSLGTREVDVFGFQTKKKKQNESDDSDWLQNVGKAVRLALLDAEARIAYHWIQKRRLDSAAFRCN